MICAPSKELDQLLPSLVRFFVFVCIEVLRPSQLLRSCRAGRLTTLFLCKLPKRLTSTKCQYFRQALLESAVGNDRRHYFMTISLRMLYGRTWGSNPRPSEHQSDDTSYRVTGPASFAVYLMISQKSTFFWRTWTDQTLRMSRLIIKFAGPADHCVGIVVLRLNCPRNRLGIV